METKYRHIAFLVMKEATLLDITGPYEVFSQLTENLSFQEGAASPPYMLHTLSAERSKTVRTASGMTINCDDVYNNVSYEIDTLFVPGVPNNRLTDYRLNEKVLQWIKACSMQVRRLCSVCTGTFFLAEAGVLNGRKATTHWEMCAKLAHDYPLIQVEDSPIFVKDGNIYTSAGISAGMDLALALVEEDYGRSAALDVAKQMVLYLKRPGTQSQYSSVLTHQHVDYRPVQEIESWILEHLSDDLTVERLAEQISMSPRNFARVFVRETGITPAKYIDKLRVETACRYLVETRLSLKEITDACGMGTPDNMRRIFLKYLQISPLDYRKNFGSILPSK